MSGETSARVVVDRELCIGSGNCVRLAPSVFAMGDDQIATVVEGGAAAPEQLESAAASCPMAAILLDGDETRP